MSSRPAIRFKFRLNCLKAPKRRKPGHGGENMAANDLMDGFPPPQDRLVTLANWRKAPFSAWGFHNVRRLVPTADIAASGHSIPLEAGLEDGIGHVGFTGHDGQSTMVSRALPATSTDAFIVL